MELVSCVGPLAFTAGQERCCLLFPETPQCKRAKSCHAAVGRRWRLLEARLPASPLLCSVTHFIGSGWRVTSVLLLLLVVGFVRNAWCPAWCREPAAVEVRGLGTVQRLWEL